MTDQRGRARRGPRRRTWAGVVGLTLALVVGCAPSASPPASAPAPAPADDATAAFCARWDAALDAGDVGTAQGLLDAPPPILEGRTSGTSPRVWAEVEVVCAPGVGAPGARGTDRRVAPPLAGTPAGRAVCSALPGIGSIDDSGGVRLYGEADRADPYDGPMLGLVWGPATAGRGGDGPAEAVTVRGAPGSAGPITVFQQVVLPELGTQIEWQEGDLRIGIYGRRWGEDRLDELVGLADSLEVADGAVRLPDSARPAGYHEVFAGSSSSLSLVLAPDLAYQVQYGSTSGRIEQVVLSGMVQSAEAFEAFRFLTLDMERTTDGERTTIRGSAWSPADGPAVVTWRDADGFVLRVLGMGVDPPVVSAIADASRELTAAEWSELVGATGACPPTSPPDLGAGPSPVPDRTPADERPEAGRGAPGGTTP